MKTVAAAVALMASLAAVGPALAWGEPGHQLIGSAAWAILNQPGHDNARRHVQAILNLVGQHSLAEAATWADCVRDVQKSGGGFSVQYGDKTPAICKSAFPKGDAAMVAYAQNNWSQCDYTTRPGGGECHATYHFEDIPYQHGRYAPDELSVSKHDLVSAMNEAIDYLQNGHGRPGAMVVFSNAREALFVLAHLVGDVHQPLHVGAVYLDDHAQVVDPGHDEALAKRTFTTGGNDILDGTSHAQHPPNLHKAWDDIADGLGTDASVAFVAQAQHDVTQDIGDYHDWPARWASQSVGVAGDKAFTGLSFGGTGPKWTFTPSAGYANARAEAQQLQLERASVRLAELLEQIWPG